MTIVINIICSKCASIMLVTWIISKVSRCCKLWMIEFPAFCFGMSLTGSMTAYDVGCFHGSLHTNGRGGGTFTIVERVTGLDFCLGV